MKFLYLILKILFQEFKFRNAISSDM
eukprot:UN19912